MAVFASIVTPEDINAYLDQKVSAKDDPQLDFKQKLIERCATAIERETGHILQSGNFSDTFDGNGGRGFFLPRYPVNSITSVTQNGATLPTTSYALKTAIGFIKFKDFTVEGWQNYVVNYNAGYGYTSGTVANNVPLPLRDACIKWVAYTYKKATERRFGVSAISSADQSVTYFEKGVPEDVEAILSRYRRVFARAS